MKSAEIKVQAEQKLVEMEEVKQVAAPKVVDKPPSFDNLISGQHSSGYWPEQYASHLARYLQAGSIECSAVRDALQSVSLTGGATTEQVYLTLLALYILEEGFEDNEDEWQLIAQKAASRCIESHKLKRNKNN